MHLGNYQITYSTLKNIICTVQVCACIYTYNIPTADNRKRPKTIIILRTFVTSSRLLHHLSLRVDLFVHRKGEKKKNTEKSIDIIINENVRTTRGTQTLVLCDEHKY
jgi:hypothetical protein